MPRAEKGKGGRESMSEKPKSGGPDPASAKSAASEKSRAEEHEWIRRAQAGEEEERSRSR